MDKHKSRFGVGLLLLGSLGLAPVAAQTVTLEPSAEARCLTLRAGVEPQPQYPFKAWKEQLAGRVKVELVFSSPDDRPKVNVQLALSDGSRDGSSDSDTRRLFVDAVQEHVRNYRVPCLPSNSAPARLVIDYVFKPDSQRVTWQAPQDADVERRGRLLACLAHPERDKPPAYPIDAQRRNLQGRVLVSMTFNAPDQAPVLEVFARPAMQDLASVVQPWVARFRMPCHEGAPIATSVVFQFRLDGDSYGFKPLGLVQFMRMVKGISKQRLQFDLNTMGCPFDLKLVYRQPFMPNSVNELDNRNPERHPLMRWLASAELEAPARSLDSVFGDSTVITVPCARIDIQPTS